MLPFLAGRAERVLAIDLDLAPFERARASYRFPPNIVAQAGDASSLHSQPDGSVDLITALDVLEHVRDLPGTLDVLVRLLSPGGVLVVSGPTENSSTVSAVAWPATSSGAYHERGIMVVRRTPAAQLTVRRIASLYWPLVLFEIFSPRPCGDPAS
jgi:2-polyprenyl-3-methyl-5-hydroxy-6-metoxy-1,4-benzoquinol methylase